MARVLPFRMRLFIVVLLLIFNEAEGRSQRAQNILNKYFYRGGISNRSKSGKKQNSGKKKSGKKQQVTGRKQQASSKLYSLQMILNYRNPPSPTPLTLQQYINQKAPRPTPSRSPRILPPSIQNFISDNVSIENYSPIIRDAGSPITMPASVNDEYYPFESPAESPAGSPFAAPSELSPMAPSYWEMPFAAVESPTPFPIQALLSSPPKESPIPVLATPSSTTPLPTGVVITGTASPTHKSTLAPTFFPRTDAPIIQPNTVPPFTTLDPTNIPLNAKSPIPTQMTTNGAFSNTISPSIDPASTESTFEPKSSIMNEPAICSVCGYGKHVGNHSALFKFQGQPPVSCSALESAGEEAIITPHQCAVLSTLIQDVCDCREEVFHVHYVTDPPILQPVLSPIEAPGGLAPSPIATPSIASSTLSDSTQQPLSTSPSLETSPFIRTESAPVTIQPILPISTAPSNFVPTSLSPDIELTAAPYSSRPTPPTVPIFQREFQSNSISMTLTGNFQLLDVESKLFQIIQLELQRYLLFESNIQNILEDFELSMTFQQATANKDGTIVVLVKLIITAMLEDTDVSTINSYNKEKLTKSLLEFFQKHGVKRLKHSLVNAGIQISLLTMQDELASGNENGSLDKDDGSSTGLLAGAMAGGAVFIALTVAMCINRKKHFCIPQEIASNSKTNAESARLLIPFGLFKKEKKNENENFAPLSKKKSSIFEDFTENEDYLLDAPDFGSYQSKDPVDYSIWDGPDLLASTETTWSEQHSITDSSVYTRQNDVDDHQLQQSEYKTTAPEKKQKWRPWFGKAIKPSNENEYNNEETSHSRRQYENETDSLSTIPLETTQL